MKKILLFLCILLLPLNTFAYSDYVVLGGKTLGIKVDTKGIMVIGFYKVDGKFNKGSPAMQNGDYIISVEDEYVNNVNELYYWSGEAYILVGVGNLPVASSETAGVLKLYKTTGNSEDGSMTQKSITEELGKKVSATVTEGSETIVFSFN